MERVSHPGPLTARIAAIYRGLDAVERFLRHPGLPRDHHNHHRAHAAELALEVAERVQRGADLVLAASDASLATCDPAAAYYELVVVDVVEALSGDLGSFASLSADRRARVLRVAVACLAAGATTEARDEWTPWAVENVGPAVWSDVCDAHDRRVSEQALLLHDMRANPEATRPDRAA